MSASWIVVMVALWLTVILLVVVTLGLIRRVAMLEVAADIITRTPATPAPPGLMHGVKLPVVAGYEHLAQHARSSPNEILLFLGSSCEACRTFARELAARPGRGALIGVGTTLITDTDGATVFSELAVSTLIIDQDRQLTRAFEVPGTPFAMAVDEHRTVRAASFVTTFAQLAELAAVLAGPVAPDPGEGVPGSVLADPARSR